MVKLNTQKTINDLETSFLKQLVMFFFCIYWLSYVLLLSADRWSLAQ